MPGWVPGAAAQARASAVRPRSVPRQWGSLCPRRAGPTWHTPSGHQQSSHDRQPRRRYERDLAHVLRAHGVDR
jgi:hypothetical protein